MKHLQSSTRALFLAILAVAGAGLFLFASMIVLQRHEHALHPAQKGVSLPVVTGKYSMSPPLIFDSPEKQFLNHIHRLRNISNLTTYTYVQSPVTGKFMLLCQSVGYGLPFAAEDTSPSGTDGSPRPDGSGLYSTAGGVGVWIACRNSRSDVSNLVLEQLPVTVSRYPLTNTLVQP